MLPTYINLLIFGNTDLVHFLFHYCRVYTGKMDRSLDSSSLTSLETMPSPDVKDQMPSVQMRSATSNQNLPREISKVVTSNYPSSSLSESSVTLSTGMKMSQYPRGLSWSHDVWWVWCIFLAEFSVFHHFNFKSLRVQ